MSMDFLTVVVVVVVVGAIALAITYAARRNKVRAYLANIENPAPIQSALSVPEAMRQVRAVLKNRDFSTRKWQIKEDNPNGMIMAILAFDEDLGALAAAAKRQIVLTVSVTPEAESTTVRLLFNVYATFGRISADAILKETTSSIKEAVQAVL